MKYIKIFEDFENYSKIIIPDEYSYLYTSQNLNKETTMDDIMSLWNEVYDESVPRIESYEDSIFILDDGDEITLDNVLMQLSDYMEHTENDE